MDKPPLITLVESDDLIRQLATRWLDSMGYRVQCVGAGGRPAVSASLIIADVSNPKKAGSVVRSFGALHSAPILLVSARFQRADGASIELAQQLGVAGILAKPFSKDELRIAIVSVLNRSGEIGS